VYIVLQLLVYKREYTVQEVNFTLIGLMQLLGLQRVQLLEPSELWGSLPSLQLWT
jgi:hypothetical protein